MIEPDRQERLQFRQRAGERCLRP